MNKITREILELDTDILFANSDFIREDGSLNIYSAPLPVNFLNLFDTVEYKTARIDGKFVRDQNGKLIMAGVTFSQINGVQKIESIRDFLNYIQNIFKVDDDNWTDVDKLRIDSGVWRGRMIFQDGVVCLRLDNNQKVAFELTSYNKLIDRILLSDSEQVNNN